MAGQTVCAFAIADEGITTWLDFEHVGKVFGAHHRIEVLDHPV